MRISEREMHPSGILYTTMKGKVYMQSSKVKIQINRQNRNQQSAFGMKQTNAVQKRVHPQHGVKDSWKDRIHFHGSNSYINNDKWNQ